MRCLVAHHFSPLDASGPGLGCAGRGLAHPALFPLGPAIRFACCFPAPLCVFGIGPCPHPHLLSPFGLAACTLSRVMLQCTCPHDNASRLVPRYACVCTMPFQAASPRVSFFDRRLPALATRPANRTRAYAGRPPGDRAWCRWRALSSFMRPPQARCPGTKRCVGADRRSAAFVLIATCRACGQACSSACNAFAAQAQSGFSSSAHRLSNDKRPCQSLPTRSACHQLPLVPSRLFGEETYSRPCRLLFRLFCFLLPDAVFFSNHVAPRCRMCAHAGHPDDDIRGITH